MNEVKRKFDLGRLVITASAGQRLTRLDIVTAMSRHARGDWGDVGPEDWRENEFSVVNDLRLLSAYHAADGTRFWVITGADRSATTILLPDDY